MVLTSPKENNRPAVHITYTEIISLFCARNNMSGRQQPHRKVIRVCSSPDSQEQISLQNAA